MITIDKTYQDKLVEYFSKGIYNTNEILKEAQYSSIYLNVKDFLENLTFEENGILKEDVLFSENSNNKKIIEDFFTRLTNRFGPNSRDIFIDTQKINGSIQCDYSSLDNDEQVKCIKKSSLNWKDMIAFGRIVICFFTIKKRSHHKHTKRYAPTSQKCQRKIPFKTPRRKRVFPQKTHHSNHPCTMHPIKNPLRKVFTKKNVRVFSKTGHKVSGILITA